jgi:hypothetical protein
MNKHIWALASGSIMVVLVYEQSFCLRNGSVFLPVLGTTLSIPVSMQASLKMLPGKRVTPTAVFMYGYNAAIKIRNHLAGTEIHRETYSGFSAGAGIDAKTGKAGSNKFSVTLFLPFRTSVFHNDYENFKEAGYEFQSKPVPIAISIGYHLAIADKLRKG